jgi:hypothetical protein
VNTIYVFLLIALISIFSGCGSSTSEKNGLTIADSPMPAYSPVPEKTAPPAETQSAPGFDGTAGKTEKKNSKISAVAVMSDVRSARHEGYDRVVFEFDGSELPTYHIEYIDKPVRGCGSGDVVPFAGDGWLEVRFSDSQAHTPEGQPTIKDRSRSPNLPIVKDLKITCDFEAEVTWVMGVSSPNRYRVIELSNPTRLVIDIKHD